MLIYAGIDEAGYGPIFGPLVVARTVWGLHDSPASSQGPNLWQILSKAVCRDVKTARQGRVAVNDSKKLHTSGNGVRHLERGVLAFAALAGTRPATVCDWLDGLGEQTHRNLTGLPWYAPAEDRPWQSLPLAQTQGEVAVARGMVAAAAKQTGVTVLDFGAAVVFEDRFNRMVAATRSKAAMSFTFVAGHLNAIWQRFGNDAPLVIVDRQSGRRHYRELLSMNFPEARLTIEHETNTSSEYRLEASLPKRRAMTVRFQIDAESAHLPVALASMISKYTRELLMARFQTWFAHRAPCVKPTAGYATDAIRFWREIQPTLSKLSISPQQLRRIS